MTRQGGQRPADIAHDWWGSLARSESGSARGALARLRRAATPLDVMQEPEALRLIVALGHSHAPHRAAVLAGVLASVRESDDITVARSVGRGHLDGTENVILSEARFRRLLQSTEDERMEHMRRLVRLLKGKAHVPSLADGILFWGERVKQRWILEYYGAIDAHPSSRPAEQQEGTDSD